MERFRKNVSILSQTLKKAAETLILCSGQKCLCLVVDCHKQFQFCCQTGIALEKVYATLYSALESKSLWLLFKTFMQGTMKSMSYSNSIQSKMPFYFVILCHKHAYVSWGAFKIYVERGQRRRGVNISKPYRSEYTLVYF